MSYGLSSLGQGTVERFFGATTEVPPRSDGRHFDGRPSLSGHSGRGRGTVWRLRTLREPVRTTDTTQAGYLLGPQAGFDRRFASSREGLRRRLALGICGACLAQSNHCTAGRLGPQ
jgi:hypothetical protein